MAVDLHLHTTASDGSLSPKDLVKNAIKFGYQAIAITDHDTIEGIPLALKAAQDSCLEIIPGIEINTDVKDHEVHILGYFIDYHYLPLLKKLKELKLMRRKRAKKILDRLKIQGIEIEWDYLLNIAGNGTIGRSHIARAIINKGYVHSWNEAFTKYVGRNSFAYVPRERLDPGQAINIIKKSGGVPVLAHPGLIGDENLIKKIIELGVQGIEVFYYEHNNEQVEKYKRLAEKYDLVMTGGSDDHGPGNKDGSRLGAVKLSYRIVEKLKELV